MDSNLKHSTHTALHNICHQITKGFNYPRSLQRTVAAVVVLDMSKCLIYCEHTQTYINKHFNHHHPAHSKLHKRTTSMHSLQRHSIKTQTNQHLSTKRWSSVCFQFYSTFTPLAFHFFPKDVKITTFFDNTSVTASHTKNLKVQRLI